MPLQRIVTALAVIATAAGGGAAATAGGGAAATVRLTRTGTVVNTCANPVLDRDLAGWGAHNTGAAGTRTATAAHVVADYAYVQPPANGANPEMYLPQKPVATGEQWRFAMDTWASGPATTATARMQVDWYDAAGTYLGHLNGPDVAVTPATAEQWTRVQGDFTVPAGAVRANVTARLAAPAGMTWAATACDYQQLGDNGSTPPPQGDTAAGRYGWGTALPASDEFNYGSAAAPAVPDRTKWTIAGDGVGLCWPGHNQNGRRCDANSRVLGGFLRMTGEADGDSGWLASETGQRYGRWEVRARSRATAANNGRQYHPVLITWPDSDEWPAGAEYDYLENDAPGEACAEAFLHYPDHQPRVQEHAEKCGVDLKQWHNFGFEWTPQHVRGFIDGVEWFSFGADCVQCAPGPMHQTIQLDNFFGDAMQAAVLEVDWARVYAIPGVTR